MGVHKVNVELDGRAVQMIVNEGVLATMETGTHVNKVQKPQNRVCVIVQTSDNKPTAWVQISKAEGQSFVVTSEGWIADRAGAASFGNAPRGSISQASGREAEMQATSKFGILACCTSYGNGCYVTCCGGCCSDPTGCPGAGCCP